MKYSKAEIQAHLEKAKVLVERGAGSYTSYAREHGVPKTTFHQWLKAAVDTTTKRSRPSERSIVKLGKLAPVVERQTIIVDYYGSRIEMGTTQDLVELLKGVRKASST